VEGHFDDCNLGVSCHHSQHAHRACGLPVNL